MRSIKIFSVVTALAFVSGCEDATGPAFPDDPNIPELPYARGIRMTHVEANQGVGIRILDGDRWIPPGERNARLIQNRQTLLWGVWDVDPGWKPRTIRAELHITLPDGRSTTLVHQLPVGREPSTFESRERSFSWEIQPDLAVPGAAFRIFLLEAAGKPKGRYPDPLPIYPPEPKPVGFEASYQVIRVTVVPVEHQYPGSCPDVPQLSTADLETLGELLHRRNPTEQVVMTLREPFVWTESLESYQGLLAALSQLRFQDDADPAEYYAGLVHHCVRTGGQAIDIPDFPTRENGWTRTVVSAWRGTAPVTASTFVHEMGHAQGRRHVRCTGKEGSPDPDYPYPRGNIGVWGYNIVLPGARMEWLSGRTYHPDTTWDYMGYCTGAHHVSDYGWERVYPFIQEISSWEMEEPVSITYPGEAVPSGREGILLVGILEPEALEGKWPGPKRAQEWFSVPGRAGDRSPTPGFLLEVMAEGAVTRLPVSVRPQGQSGVVNVVAELPAPVDQVSSVSLLSPGGRIPIALGAIRKLPSVQ